MYNIYKKTTDYVFINIHNNLQTNEFALQMVGNKLQLSLKSER